MALDPLDSPLVTFGEKISFDSNSNGCDWLDAILIWVPGNNNIISSDSPKLLTRNKFLHFSRRPASDGESLKRVKFPKKCGQNIGYTEPKN